MAPVQQRVAVTRARWITASPEDHPSHRDCVLVPLAGSPGGLTGDFTDAICTSRNKSEQCHLVNLVGGLVTTPQLLVRYLAITVPPADD